MSCCCLGGSEEYKGYTAMGPNSSPIGEGRREEKEINNNRMNWNNSEIKLNEGSIRKWS